MTNEQRIDLSNATAEELAQLPGIGLKLAGRIVAYRDGVRPFKEPAEIMAVPGISEKAYRAIASQLTVGESATLETEQVEETEEMEVTIPQPEPRDKVLEPASTEGTLVAKPEPDPHAPPPPTPTLSADRQSPPHLHTPATSARPGYVGLPVAALLAALFGALLALLVIGGINGTLDFGQAEAVVRNQAKLDHLTIQADTLQSDLDGLRQRLDRLEGLAGRMDGVEQAVDDLDTALSQTQVEVDALNTRADQLNADIAAVRAAAGRFDTFLDGLRDLLFEFQGAPPTPTPTPTPPPTATSRPTRTPRPSPTPRPTHTPYFTPTPTGAP